MFQLLLVDDETSVVETLAATIAWEQIGISRVYKAYSAAEALDILKANAVDIVISDIQMRGMSGLELAEQIHLYWENTKCVLLSGYAEFDYAQKAIKHNICDYLIKPVGDEQLLQRIGKVVELIKKEQAEKDTYHKARYALRDNLPNLREKLFHDLLRGKRMSGEKLNEKLRLLELSLRDQDRCALMLIRNQEQPADYDSSELSLIEYAIGNLAEETFKAYFDLWVCKDAHDFLVVILKPHDRIKQDSELRYHLERLANQLQLNVRHFLKVQISVLVSQKGTFPDDFSRLYQNALSLFRKRFGDERDLPIYIADESEKTDTFVIQQLYEPPLLVHLLESGNWELVRQRLDNLFEELEAVWQASPEHIMEAFCTLFAAFSFVAHKNGTMLADLIGREYAKGQQLAPTKSIPALREWTARVVETMQEAARNETRNARVLAVKTIQDYVQKNLTQDISLQAVSDYLQMHPAYLSRIYKLETGENLSDYIFKLKMGRAAHILRTSHMKIYEVSMEVGYQNPNYFIKVFKKHFGMTPQEYRIGGK
ncbi:response regulator [Paenibacillus alkalitolerans]|uniref:response regulator n=1 Tax=Paenibacillus alkalitolerans TaxID=2799335 RepID=UPI0018F2BB8A|nr:response regulator [Paenibacillus alkalitolerans]